MFVTLRNNLPCHCELLCHSEPQAKNLTLTFLLSLDGRGEIASALSCLAKTKRTGTGVLYQYTELHNLSGIGYT